MTFDRAAQQGAYHDYAHQYMETVKACQQVKYAAVDTRIQGEIVALIVVDIFMCLQSEERNTQQYGHQQSRLENPVLAPLVNIQVMPGARMVAMVVMILLCTGTIVYGRVSRVGGDKFEFGGNRVEGVA